MQHTLPNDDCTDEPESGKPHARRTEIPEPETQFPSGVSERRFRAEFPTGVSERRFRPEFPSGPRPIPTERETEALLT